MSLRSFWQHYSFLFVGVLLSLLWYFVFIFEIPDPVINVLKYELSDDRITLGEEQLTLDIRVNRLRLCPTLYIITWYQNIDNPTEAWININPNRPDWEERMLGEETVTLPVTLPTTIHPGHFTRQSTIVYACPEGPVEQEMPIRELYLD